MGHKKNTKNTKTDCGCGKKHKKSYSTKLTTSSETIKSSYDKKSEHHHTHGHNCACKCEQKYYFPLPATPSQPVGGMSIKTDAWFAPGSVQACCSICSTVQPVYANPCNTCRYDKKTYPINNTAYFTTNQYLY